MLNEKPCHAGGLLGAKGDVSTTLVDKVVHLFRHHIGLFAEAREDADVFQYGWHDFAVTGPRDDVGKHRGCPPDTSGIGREQVPHSGTGAESGHGARLPVVLACARENPVGVVHRVNLANPADDGGELGCVGQFKFKTHLRHSIVTGHGS